MLSLVRTRPGYAVFKRKRIFLSFYNMLSLNLVTVISEKLNSGHQCVTLNNSEVK